MKRVFAILLSTALVVLCCGCAEKTDKYLLADRFERTTASICGWNSEGEYFHGGVSDKNKLTGMFYFNWLGQHPKEQSGIYDITKLSESNPEAIWDAQSKESPINEYHFWGEPLYGYYNAADPWVIRKHIEMFINSGIGFLGLDATNAFLYEDVYETLFSVIAEFRDQGFNYPRICFLTNSSSRNTVFRLYELYYSKPEYNWLWFYRDGKPFIVLDKAEFDFRDPQITKITDKFSFRHVQWPYFPAYDEGFPWISYDYPQYNHNGIMSVSVAQHTAGAMSRTGNQGRGYDYISGQNNPSLIATCSNYRAQWDTAIQTEDVELVFLTGWNEWMALKLSDSGEHEVRYTDAFNYEFSRDIEPSLREDGDAYYLETVKRNQMFQTECTGVSALSRYAMTIDSNIDELYKNNKAMVYTDLRGDTALRDFAGAVESLHYTNNSGRNDIVSVGVSNDGKNMYILIECAEEITPYTDDCWLNILLRTGNSEYTINKQGPGVLSSETESVICENVLQGNRFWIKIPFANLKDKGKTCALRVMDHVEEGVLGIYSQGDSAPLGNLFYEYKFD